jgi:hypothetical protein
MMTPYDFYVKACPTDFFHGKTASPKFLVPGVGLEEFSTPVKLSFYNPNTAYTYPFTFLAWYVHSNKRWQD